ncbi:hypothetical protein [Empedobacter brevis]|uniref:hypothetical protein n=1 Tax=Empedobacter brevis TaxID=247 RepID=UPI0039AEA85C
MREISFLKEKILQYIESKSVTKYEFYQKTGISNGVLSQKSGLSEDNLLRFLSYYKDVNPEWLLTGKGSMLKEDAVNKVNQSITGDGNIQSGNNTSITGDCKEKVQELQKQLKEKDKEIERQKKQIDKLFNMIP